MFVGHHQTLHEHNLASYDDYTNNLHANDSNFIGGNLAYYATIHERPEEEEQFDSQKVIRICNF